MPVILVKKYPSLEDRSKQENGTLVGTAESYEEFTKLVGQAGSGPLGYTENGESLHYEQVERRFGRTTPRTRIDESTGEEY